MGVYVYDAGALVAADRNSDTFWSVHKATLSKDVSPVVPAPVVAQAWRKTEQVRIARLLKGSRVVPMDLALARRVGRLCGATSTTDVVDATVAVLAADLKATVLTSDPKDITHLVDELNALDRVEIVSV
jgi:PIN domain nuclease of toxin-antitoxin system